MEIEEWPDRDETNGGENGDSSPTSTPDRDVIKRSDPVVERKRHRIQIGDTADDVITVTNRLPDPPPTDDGD